MAQIFISYSRSNRPFLNNFVPLMRRVYGNDSLWFDADIYGGADWWQMILKEIAACDLFIYLISSESLESPYCRAELREALRLKKQILPVVVRRLNSSSLDGIEPDLAEVLRRTQYVDLSSGFKDPNSTAGLYAAINHMLRQVPQEAPTPSTSQPIPLPTVSDKPKTGRPGSLFFGIGLFGLLIAMIIGIFWLSRSEFGTGDPATATSPATIPIAQVGTEAPTLSSFQILETVEKASTLETAANATLIVLSATPTVTPTLSPDQLALATVISNSSWTPVERDFDGVTMVFVPAGCFMMGSEDALNEQPIHEQCFSAPFWIDKTEVTQAQLARLGGVKATVNDFEGENRPVENINWFEARDFCTQRGARLPTEREWEYAARGPDSLVYPWSSDWNEMNVVWNRTRSQGTREVGIMPGGRSWVGALDMSGNVWEWTNSVSKAYPYEREDGRENDTETGNDVLRVLRGGSWLDNNNSMLRSAYRTGGYPNVKTFGLGFRCVRSF